ncbi:molybdenum cofactor biosynthesis protein MoaE [Shimia thalassica]|uniref:molybdenum cofactor biosynthesis protein MoaE n=1 Tax=Shimia thalassica TaxID=1715693 RepID=UPI0026E1E900|nr:molybdenum cofactor biosynthesis protein MoaE [Shimia thalassica]MDO6523282.1 molybdenum cofactor biosynthesis protein MoaE [Shimia thalassica]
MKTELVIPTLDNNGSDNAEIIRKSIAAMCQTFGGATVYDASGFWVNADGRLYEDGVKVIVSAATEENAALDLMRDIARDVLDATDQEAVFLAVGDKAEIIE